MLQPYLRILPFDAKQKVALSHARFPIVMRFGLQLYVVWLGTSVKNSIIGWSSIFSSWSVFHTTHMHKTIQIVGIRLRFKRMTARFYQSWAIANQRAYTHITHSWVLYIFLGKHDAHIVLRIEIWNQFLFECYCCHGYLQRLHWMWWISWEWIMWRLKLMKLLEMHRKYSISSVNSIYGPSSTFRAARWKLFCSIIR